MVAEISHVFHVSSHRLFLTINVMLHNSGSTCNLGLVSNLYRAARMANDVTTLASGNPHRIARRAKNKIIGRAAARAGVWRTLWR